MRKYDLVESITNAKPFLASSIFLLLITLLFPLILSFLPGKAHAFIFDTLKDILKINTNSFSISSNISLAPGGDENNNGKIDAGDIVRFTYIVNNPTKTLYPFATLKTRLNLSMLNYIHNVTGATGYTDSNNTIDFPNFRILPQQTQIVSFDARTMYYTDADKTLTTQAEILTHDKKSLFKDSQTQKMIKKITKEKLKFIVGGTHVN